MEKKDWFKDRGYKHFSNRTPPKLRKIIENYVCNPEKIAKHSFYPLIFKEISQRRYKLADFNGTERHSHKKMKDGKVISNAKIREILYASHIDAHIYSYYAQKIISEKYEEYLDANTHVSTSISAYRQIPTFCNTKFKNNAHFAKDVFDEIKQRQNCVALAFDIENFFPSLNHKLLKVIWARILGKKALPPDHYNIFKAVTKFSYVKLEDLKIKGAHFDEKKLIKLKKSGKNTFFENIEELIDSDITIHKNQKHKNGNILGIPQGLPISALLANIYMLPFDEAVIDILSEEHNIFYRRYSDDIVVVCKEEQVVFVQAYIKEQIEKIKLVISLPKTEVTMFKYDNGRLQSFRIVDGILKKNIPLNYLGFEFYGYQTLLKSKNLAGFYREMKNSVNTKNKRSERLKEKYLQDNGAIFKRKIYRMYSFKGHKTRMLPAQRSEFINGKLVLAKFERKYRGNYIRYVYRAAEEMGAPEIKRQVRNHWQILMLTICRFEFTNNKMLQKKLTNPTTKAKFNELK